MEDKLQKQKLHVELRIYISALKTRGVEFAGTDVVDLEVSDLREIRRQLRDLLCMLGE